MIGTRLAHFEITHHLGNGGMGEVYQASDLKLGRSVAIKFIPEAFSQDNDRVARFEREARVLASLNHPNIAAIFGVEESAGRKFLVMELVPGETLGEKINRGPMTLEESLEIAMQIAEALEAAHDKGIVHRDLKPANIKVTADGKVKVLDFGLAKARESGEREKSLSNSPTLSIGATNAGMILGTAAYMSPEQAKGAEVDRRTDIFAFGSVLFEMLTGRQAFHGDTVSDIMASVLKVEPDYVVLPAAVPQRLRVLLQRCLQKDPKKRLRDVGDLRFELEQVRQPSIETVPIDEPRPARISPRNRILWLATIVGAILATWLFAGMLKQGAIEKPAAASALVRFSVSPPEGASIYTGGWLIPFAISPNGHWLAFTATSSDGRSRLWVRPMNSEIAQSISGTEGALTPFWSPDSEWLGFQMQNTWYRVRIPGGVPESISPFRGYSGGNQGGVAWGKDVILFPGLNGGLFRVSVQGGKPSQVTQLDVAQKERSHLWPQFLSDGKHFLYVSRGDNPRIFADSVDGNQRTPVMDLPGGLSTIRYVPGYLFYVENMILWAQPFDESTLRLNGERRRVASGVPAGGPGAAPFSVSNTGVLAYWTQALIQQAAQLQWMDRKGNRLSVVGAPAVYDGFDLSRDESRLAYGQVDSNGIEMWVQDLAAGGGRFPMKISPLATVPVWTPDQMKLVFLLTGSLYLADAAPNAHPTDRLTSPSRNQLAQCWTNSGEDLLFEDWSFENLIDLAVLHLKDRSVTRLDINTTSNEFGGRLSPDNRWLAYVTDQSGLPQVWVMAYPSGLPRRQVSTFGGSHPDWKGDGRELYFVSSDGQLVATSFDGSGSSMSVGTSANLFPIPRTIDVSAGSHNIYKASRDGQRFLVAARTEVSKVPPISVILNWPEL